MNNEQLSLEEIERLKKEKSRIIKIRLIFVLIGAALIILSFLTVGLSVIHVDAHSTWFPPLLWSMISVMVVGIVLCVIGSAFYKHRLYKIRDILCKYPEIEK